MVYKHLYEVFEQAAKEKTVKAKEQFLKDNNSLALRDFVKGAYDPKVTFNWIPKGPIPFEKAKVEDLTSSLLHKTSEFPKISDNGPGSAMKQIDKERTLITLRETIHPKDADLVSLMLTNKFKGKYKGITVKLCTKVWPKLFL